MNVLCIASYDDHKVGEVTAVVELPESCDGDTVFIAWLKSIEEFYRDKSNEECLKALYVWQECKVKSVV